MSGEVELVGSNQARQRRSEPTRWSNLTEHEKRQRGVPAAFVPQSPRGADLTKHAPPSPLYSSPGHFWLSMGGYDSGFLYHCQFSEEQDQDPLQSLHRSNPT
ncbi:hypothetical protein JOQ06_001769 [Pogonophryne albipinna]|uniref:Uncharacterized protein n=1 Tax=Pogonophryne albipinna TaxID=1090488 RepID=A0AAD6B5F6_9TELE|nr:hypothetical protein JOQ06_001769 [Pogonophryne albipinna]